VLIVSNGPEDSYANLETCIPWVKNLRERGVIPNHRQDDTIKMDINSLKSRSNYMYTCCSN
jgi:hypothetical protein